MRYYGPTGYALVAVTIAVEGRIRNYFDICNNMLETISTAGWSTAPKPVPAQPACSIPILAITARRTTGTTRTATSGTGMAMRTNSSPTAATANIDDDTGEYMEANDAGWDPDEEDYYDDYDPWSDPATAGCWPQRVQRCILAARLLVLAVRKLRLRKKKKK